MKVRLLRTGLFLSVLLRPYCGRQCISLRGHRDDSTAGCDCNRGNFLALYLIIVLSQEMLPWLSICKKQGRMLCTLAKLFKMT